MKKTLHSLIMHKLFWIIFLIALVFIGWYLFDSSSRNLNNSVNEQISRSVNFVAYEQEGWINRTEQLLTVLSDVSEIKTGRSKECSDFLARVLETYPRYANFGLLDSKGDLICSALPFAGVINVSERIYFQKTLEEKKFSVGEYQIGKVTKKRSLNFGYPIFDERGEIKYVLFAALDLNWVLMLIDQLDLPEESSVFLIDRQGIILSAIPEHQTFLIGKKFLDEDILTEVFSKGTGTVDGVDPWTKNETIYSFTTLTENNDVFFILTLPYKFVANQIWMIVLPYLLVLGLGFLVLFSIFLRFDTKSS